MHVVGAMRAMRSRDGWSYTGNCVPFGDCVVPLDELEAIERDWLGVAHTMQMCLFIEEYSL